VLAKVKRVLPEATCARIQTVVFESGEELPAPSGLAVMVLSSAI
jgi:hypothetical protein